LKYADVLPHTLKPAESRDCTAPSASDVIRRNEAFPAWDDPLRIRESMTVVCCVMFL
jgi:hypothetical protein